MKVCLGKSLWCIKEMGGGKEEHNIVSSFKLRKGCLTYLCGAHLLDRFSFASFLEQLIIIRFAELIHRLGDRLRLLCSPTMQP